MSYGLSDIPNVGEAVTLTVWGKVAADRTVGVYNTFGNRELARLAKVKDGVYRVTFDWNAPITGGLEQLNASSKTLALFFYRRESTTVSRIDRIKLERGTVGTDWTPAPEDGEAATANALNQARQDAQTKADAAKAQIEQAAHPPFDTGGKRNPDNPDRLSFQKLFRKKTVTIRLLAPPCPNAAPAAFFASFEVGKVV